MLKRTKLKVLLRKITDDQFNAILKSTYGYVAAGQRADLVKDFVADQYDGELDGCIKRVESLLNPTPTPRPKPLAQSPSEHGKSPIGNETLNPAGLSWTNPSNAVGHAGRWFGSCGTSAGKSTTMRVPLPGVLLITRVLQRPRARSWMPSSPKWPSLTPATSKPTPQS